MDYPGEMKIKMDHAAFEREQAARQGCSNASCYCTGACKETEKQMKERLDMKERYEIWANQI